MAPNRKRKSVWIKQLLGLFLLLLVLLGVGLFVHLQAKLPSEVRARFRNPDGSQSLYLSLQLAINEEQRSKGLMFVTNLPPDQGMLFVFPRDEQQVFWMKNTYIALDIIFIDSNLKVVGILENVPPLSETPRRVDAASKYVVELIAGSAKKNSLTVGSVLEPARALPAALP